MGLRFKFTGAIGKLIFLAAAFLVFAINSNAAGALDPTFGANGRAVTTVGAGARASAIAIQPDGKIVVAGDVLRAGSQRDVALVRYNADGTPDLSFGANGRIIIAVSNRNEFINAVTIDASGRIVVVGSIETSDDTATITDFLVVRFTPNGTLDAAFGSGGAVTISQGSIDSFNAVAIQPSGRIVAAGGTSDGGLAVMVGFTSQGTLDLSFGDAGLNFFDVRRVTDEQVQAIALRPDGRILVGGRGRVTDPHPGDSSFLAEFDSDGTPVQNFGTNGTVILASGFIPFGFDLAVLPDGTALVVSDKLYRVSTAGAIDSNFGNAINGSEIALLSDGKFVVTYASLLLNQQTGLFAPNGRLIGRDKKLTANDLAVQPDDKIVFITSTETEFVATRVIAITSQGTRLADYDRDERTDFAVYRRENWTLYALGSSIGALNYRSPEFSFIAVKKVIPETDGCNSSLPFLYWMSGRISTDKGYFVRTDGTDRQQTQWGVFGDVPVGGDYDGDTCTDSTVYRPSEGVWYILPSSNSQPLAIRWGLPEDNPVPADYDYDGITDVAVYRPSDGTWYVRRSSDGNLLAVRWGNASDIPLTGDFDGDGRADFAVYRPSERTWYLLQTRNGFRAERFGLENDYPVPGDYDGDGRHDIAVYRRQEGFWYILGSTRGFYAAQWGTPSDEPVAVRYDF